MSNLIWINNGKENIQIDPFEFTIYMFKGYSYGKMRKKDIKTQINDISNWLSITCIKI